MGELLEASPHVPDGRIIRDKSGGLTKDENVNFVIFILIYSKAAI